jgi:hypothetical protein
LMLLHDCWAGSKTNSCRPEIGSGPRLFAIGGL